VPSVETFSYAGLELGSGGSLCAHYRVGGYQFAESVSVGAGASWSDEAAHAARLVYLLAAVSYYKALAPPAVDLGSTPVTPAEVEFLRTFYVDGLGEFAFRNGLDLSGLTFAGGEPAEPAPAPTAGEPLLRPLIPFGGGIDSIVTTELVKHLYPGASLFVLNRPDDRFAAIEEAAAVTGLPVLRAERELDPQILRSAELGFLNGHVPITGVVSAVAVLAAAAHGFDAVVMSNERSASTGNVVLDGRPVNHQWSKSWDFEHRFAGVVAEALGGRVSYFSLLRPWSELWIAERFSRLEGYQLAFRSCNRAFAVDPGRRLETWCGECDKCCFIDLILAPFLPVDRLREIFLGAEPLEDPGLMGRFRTLLGLSPDIKPWECVGDVEECRAAAVLAADRDDRAGNAVLAALAEELGPSAGAARDSVPRLLRPAGDHLVPAPLAAAAAGA
jgi:hypothetical protein